MLLFRVPIYAARAEHRLTGAHLTAEAIEAAPKRPVTASPSLATPSAPPPTWLSCFPSTSTGP